MLAKNGCGIVERLRDDIINNEIYMREAIFKATYLEDEVKIADELKIELANILPIVGIDWTNKGIMGKNFRCSL